MPTPAWREEKAEFVVESICRVLTIENLPEDVKRELSGALWNSLKLFTEALEQRINSKETRWSPDVVDWFLNNPNECKYLLKRISEPDFSAAEYWQRS